jgi:hypothetical protein
MLDQMFIGIMKKIWLTPNQMTILIPSKRKWTIWCQQIFRTVVWYGLYTLLAAGSACSEMAKTLTPKSAEMLAYDSISIGLNI